MDWKVQFNDRGGVYASIDVEADDAESALEQGRRWALEHIVKRPLSMSLVFPKELDTRRHERRCVCETCTFERFVAKAHREFSRGLLTSTEYAESLTMVSQAFLVSQLQTV